MGLLKTAIFRVLDENRESIIDLSTLLVQKSGSGGRLPLPKFLVGRVARRIIYDDGDDIVVVVLVEKKENIEYGKWAVKHLRKMPSLEDIESPERARYWLEDMCIKYLKKRGYRVEEGYREAGEGAEKHRGEAGGER